MEFGEKKCFSEGNIWVFYRVTFLIDEKGVIEQVITDVDTKNHTQQILG